MCAERKRDTRSSGVKCFFFFFSVGKIKICQWFLSRHGEKRGGFIRRECTWKKDTVPSPPKGGFQIQSSNALYRERFQYSFLFSFFLFNELEALPTNYWGLFLAAQRGETQGGQFTLTPGRRLHSLVCTCTYMQVFLTDLEWQFEPFDGKRAVYLYRPDES